MEKETWEALLSFLLAINDALLSPPAVKGNFIFLTLTWVSWGIDEIYIKHPIALLTIAWPSGHTTNYQA